VGQTERLVQVGPVQAFEEGQSVAPNGVPGAEDETRRHPRVTASQLLVELPSPKTGHPEIRNDEIKLLAGRSLQGLFSVGGDNRNGSPCLEGRPHVVEMWGSSSTTRTR